MLPRLVLLVLVAVPAVASSQDNTYGGRTSGEWLMMLKEDKESKRRRAAVIVLEVFGPKVRGVVPGLCEALEKDAEPELRREVALLLGRMGPDAKEAVPHLAEALKKDKVDGVREAAALALSEKLSSFAYEHVLVLGTALKDPHAGTRAAAAMALNAFGDKARLALPQIMDVAKDKKADRLPRLYAVQIVSRLQTDQPETGSLLVDIVNDGAAPATLRSAAAEGLGRREKTAKEELHALTKLLTEKPVELRRAAATALAKLGEQAAPVWPQIQPRLADEDNTVRFQLIRVAGGAAREHKEALEALGQLTLKDAHVENRLAAIGELGQLGSAAGAVAAVLEGIATQDARAAIREAAAAALKRIRS